MTHTLYTTAVSALIIWTKSIELLKSLVHVFLSFLGDACNLLLSPLEILFLIMHQLTRPCQRENKHRPLRRALLLCRSELTQLMKLESLFYTAMPIDLLPVARKSNARSIDLLFVGRKSNSQNPCVSPATLRRKHRTIKKLTNNNSSRLSVQVCSLSLNNTITCQYLNLKGLSGAQG